MDTLPVEMVNTIYEYLTLPKDKLKFALSFKYAYECLSDESKRIFSILLLMYSSILKVNQYVYHFISNDATSSILVSNKVVKYESNYVPVTYIHALDGRDFMYAVNYIYKLTLNNYIPNTDYRYDDSEVMQWIIRDRLMEIEYDNIKYCCGNL